MIIYTTINTEEHTVEITVDGNETDSVTLVDAEWDTTDLEYIIQVAKEDLG